MKYSEKIISTLISQAKYNIETASRVEDLQRGHVIQFYQKGPTWIYIGTLGRNLDPHKANIARPGTSHQFLLAHSEGSIYKYNTYYGAGPRSACYILGCVALTDTDDMMGDNNY